MKITKKILKWSGITLVVLILAMIAIPFLFKGTIKDKVMEAVNKNIKATASLQDVHISLFRNFPKVQLRLDNFVIANKEPFVGDTLFKAETITAKVSLSDLFAGKYNILGFTLKNAVANIHLNKEGQGNYDIAIPSEEEETTPFKMKIEQYNIENLDFTFKMDDGDLLLRVDDINHSGKGNFADQVLDLDTHTKANITLAMAKSTFMKAVPVTLEAILGIDLNQQKYTFKKNKATVNRLDLVFDGYLQLLEKGQHYDLTFSTPTNSFQNFLALIPEQYSKEIADVKTTGQLTLKGFVKGDMTDEKIPTFALEMYADNASFQYPSLPKAVRDITIDLKATNSTGITNDTKVNLNKFTMTIDRDHFEARAAASNLIKNPFIDLALKGTINLASLKQAYPISIDKKLAGILRMDIATQLDVQSVEHKQYQNIKANGNFSLSQFVYAGEEFVKPFHIDLMQLTFNPSHIALSEFTARTGDTDLKLKGTIDNLYGFAFKKETLKGKFDLTSNKIVINDFMQPDSGDKPAEKKAEKPKSDTKTSPKTPATESIKVPKFLDCSLSAKAGTVLYDNLKLANVSGVLIIKDEKVRLENLRSDIFGGSVAVTGGVSTKETTPTFDVDLNLNKLNIPDAFSQITMLEKIAPIAKVIQGKINSTINVKGKLKQDLTPEINSISGDLIAALLDSKVNAQASPLLSSLNSEFAGLNLSALNLKDLKAAVDFEDGRVKIKPFTIKYNDIAIEVAGQHGFDQTMKYDLKLNLPPKMLGKEAESLIAKLTPAEQKKIQTLPVTATIGGTFKKPTVNTDMKTALKDLATQVARSQMNNLAGKGADALSKTLGGAASGTTKEISNAVSGMIKNRDSTATKIKEKAKEEAKKEAKKQIGNFLQGLGGKKNE